MTNILHIETSTEICSVCISENEIPLFTKETHEGFHHASLLTSYIQKCLDASNLKMADLHAVAISAGPGSYTGLRVGVSTAKAICYGMDIPLLSVDTLKSIAWKMKQSKNKFNNANTLFCPMIDARRMEVYTALFDNDLKVICPTKALIINDKEFDENNKWSNCFVIGGNGAKKTKILIEKFEVNYLDTQCSAAHMVALALEKYSAKSFENLAHYVPNYLKMPNITTSKK